MLSKTGSCYRGRLLYWFKGLYLPYKLNTVDDYIEQYPQDIKEILDRIRVLVKKAAPQTEELLKYGMPAYYLFGKPFVSFGAQKKHVGFYGKIPETFVSKLENYKCTKGGIQLQYNEPIPYKLITELVKYKYNEILKGNIK